MNVRKAFLWSHRWFGLIAGFHFLLLGLSGSYLVYEDEIETWAKPHLRLSNPTQVETLEFSLAQLVRSAQSGLQVDKVPFSIRVPEEVHTNAIVTVNVAGRDEPRKLAMAFVDPTTYEFRGTEIYRDTLSGFLFAFHHDLFWGGTGRVIMAISGLLMVVLLMSGLYLWWPRLRPWPKNGLIRIQEAFGANSTKKMRTTLGLNLEIHRLVGFYTLVLMMVVTVSGVYISRPQWFTFGSRTESQGSDGRGAKGPNRPLEEVLKGVDARLNAFVHEGLSVRPLSVRINPRTSTINVSVGPVPHRLTFDLRSGQERVSKLASQRPSRSMRQTQHDLHVGAFWGELGRFLIFVSGLLPLYFYVTGVVIWWKKREARLRSAA